MRNGSASNSGWPSHMAAHMQTALINFIDVFSNLIHRLRLIDCLAYFFARVETHSGVWRNSPESVVDDDALIHRWIPPLLLPIESCASSSKCLNSKRVKFAPSTRPIVLHLIGGAKVERTVGDSVNCLSYLVVGSSRSILRSSPPL